MYRTARHLRAAVFEKELSRAELSCVELCLFIKSLSGLIGLEFSVFDGFFITLALSYILTLIIRLSHFTLLKSLNGLIHHFVYTRNVSTNDMVKCVLAPSAYSPYMQEQMVA